MSAPAIVVYEPSPRWAVLLRSLLPTAARRLRETRHPAECLAELTAPGVRLCVVELPAGQPLIGIELLAQIERRAHHVRTAAVADCSVADYEPLARAAGAVAFAASAWQVVAWQDWLARLAGAQPPPSELRAALWERLPWPQAAHGGSARGAHE